MTLLPLKTSLRQASLLVVEDLPDQQEIIAHSISQTIPELNLVWASDAPSALAHLADCEATDRPLPRLLLLDLYLPRRDDGWQLLRVLKSQMVLAKMPVVMLSRSNDGEDIKTSYELGAASYIAKPHTADEWIACFGSFRHYWLDAVTLPPTSY